MKMNYNEWFDKQYGYLTGNRKGKVSYNDTKFIDMGQRYKKLVDMNSELLNEQPFGVVGNNKGFDKLLDLMSKSNYTFDDINESLISTYEQSLKNAMGSMMVNTQAVMFATSNINKSNVTDDRFTHYYIIDAPFNQLHFGDRDEFIRQRLQQMHSVDTDKYVDMETFISSYISDILGFTMIITINGYICNDCKIALTDKGFKFKVGWPYSSDVKFIVYKLDKSTVSTHTISSKYITDFKSIPYVALNGLLSEKESLIGKHCIVNIYDKAFVKTVPSVVNFGTFNSTGFSIINIQNKTLDNISMNKSKKITIVIYILDYFNEVPNVYPACNYYDITDSRPVYTEQSNNVDNEEGKRIYSSYTTNVNMLEKCTPPICLDRTSTISFNTISACLELRDNLLALKSNMKDIGNAMMLYSRYTQVQFVDKIVRPINDIYGLFVKYYEDYLKGALLTSLVSKSLINKYKSFLKAMDNIRKAPDANTASIYMIDELYGDNYVYFVDTITAPFRNNALSNFTDMKDITNNYFDDSVLHFNRPISEQCFIVLRYNRIDKCWLFDYPTIKHFKGIGNTFYIDDSSLKGDEVYKFFVLYTDTKAPAQSDKFIKHMELNDVFDFDLFCEEVSKHMGYIRYWNIENKLMKISKTKYGRYDDDTCVQVLSQILKRKVEGEDILNIYPSDIDYETSAITSYGFDNMNDDSDAGPFSINFMFYTLNMMYNNNDKLQTYLMSSIVDKRYNKRYQDLNICEIVDEQPMFDVNYSQFTLAPNSVNNSISVFPDIDKQYAYYGLPLKVNTSGISTLSNAYRYVYNIYDIDIKYPLITYNETDQTKYIMYNNNMSAYGCESISYYNDIYMVTLFSLYLSMLYDYIDDLQTNYAITFNQISTITTCIKTINVHIKTISDYLRNNIFVNPNTIDIANDIITDNIVISKMSDMSVTLNSIISIKHNNRFMSIFDFMNSIISMLKNIYITTGFDLYADKRIRKFYLHLKEINTIKSIYKYKKWLIEFDSGLLQILDSLLAANENYVSSSTTFLTFYNNYIQYYSTALTAIDTLYEQLWDLIEIIHYDEHGYRISEHCDYIINNYIFDLYTIDKITYPSIYMDMYCEVNTKPYLVSIEIENDSHFYPKTISDIPTGNTTLMFQPISEQTSNGKFKIVGLSKICEYVIFDNTDLDCTINILDIDSNVIGTENVTMTFNKVGNTARKVDTFKQLMNINTLRIDIQNVHDDITVDGNTIISNVHSDMNYEMLLGNHYIQLDHTHQMITNEPKELPGPVDSIIIENQRLNNLINKECGVMSDCSVQFKPSRVIHLDIDEDGNIASVGGRYFVGQTLYASTKDGTYSFPIIVTAIDHGMNKGFVEATVDTKHSKWFRIDGKDKITEYLTTDIECEILPDNICNFMDEFSNDDYFSYSNIMINDCYAYSDENFEDKWSMRGDPLFVYNNAPYVYSRLNWMFNELVPNRFIDEESKKYRFQYIGYSEPNDINQSIEIKMLNHDFNELTNNEMYPILRQEPNDHSVWDLEILTFTNEKVAAEQRADILRTQIVNITESIIDIKNVNKREELFEEINDLNLKLTKEEIFIKKMESFILQPEQPTTWFNVRSYETAMVYISNGRAKTYPTLMPNIRDITYSDKLKVYLYDWENKCWLNPSTYDVKSNIVGNVMFDEYENYASNNVLYSINITPNDEFTPSRKILVYLAYNKSDVFNDIPMNDNTFNVRFKPVLSLTDKSSDEDSNPYNNMRIRKHLDATEKYVFSNYNKPDDFSIDNAFYIHRPDKKTGRDVYTPTIRKCDLNVLNDNVTFSSDMFDMYIRMPFKDVSTSSTFNDVKYECIICQNIDNFIPNEIIELVCIDNNDVASYNGNISNITFKASTSYVTDDQGNNQQHIEIVKSSMKHVVDGEFVCCISKSNTYRMYGSIIKVNVTITDTEIVDPLNNWVKIPDSLSSHREIPMECIFVPHEDVSIAIAKGVTFIFSNKYDKNSNDIVYDDNSSLYNSFEYYFNAKNDIRLPISNIRQNIADRRLVIDKTRNPDVKLVKSTYISICRYSLQKIPKDGFIDFTGYIPTPLSRNRYEFWVNGRFIDNPNDVIILSPTSIQLCNLKSLRNFELIELVDDMYDSDVIRHDNMYIDLEGNTFSSFENAILSERNILNQNIRFKYNIDQHQPIQDYSLSIIPNPNNLNIEVDILDTIIEEDIEDYNQMYNIPSINGIPLQHITSSSLGLIDIPTDKIISLLDDVWKLEQISNPLFPMTHRDGLFNSVNKYSALRVKPERTDDGEFIIVTSGSSQKYFTLYISDKSTGEINDTEHTLVIIPFIRVGIELYINPIYSGKWLCSTDPSCKSIKLI